MTALFVRAGAPGLDKHLPWLCHNAASRHTVHEVVDVAALSAGPRPDVTDVVLLDPSAAAARLVARRVGPRLRTLVLLNASDDPEADQVAADLGRAGVLVLGPGSNGYLDRQRCLTIAPHVNLCPPEPGPVWLVSQGGALVTVLARALANAGIGLDRAMQVAGAPTGQLEAVLDRFVAEAPPGAILLAYAEGVADPDRFFTLGARARESGRTVVVLRAGTTSAGARLVRAHTAAAAGGYASFAARAREHGVACVRGVAEAIETCRLLQVLLPAGASRTLRPAVASTSGALVSLVLDAAAAAGVELPAIRSAGEELSPLDLDAVPDGLQRLGALRRSGLTDVVLYAEQYGPPGIGAGALADLSSGLESGLPVFVWTTDRHGGDLPARHVVADLGAFWRAFAGLVAIGVLAVVSQPGAEVEPPCSAVPAAAHQQTIRRVYDHLAASGVGVAEESSEPETITGHGRFVVKLAGAAVPHRAAVGGVRLGVAATQAADEFARMADLARSLGEGVYATIAPQIEGVRAELLAAVHRDPHAGLALAVGAGGAHAGTGLPVTLVPAHARQREQARAALLNGIPTTLRSVAAPAVDGLIDALLTYPLADGEGLELNPIVVTDAGDVVVVDALPLTA